MSKTKQHTLILLVAAGGLIALLAMGLPGLVLLPAQPFSLTPPQMTGMGLSGELPGGSLFFELFRAALAVAVVLLPVYVIYSLFTAEGRRRLIFNIVMIAALLILADHLRNMAEEIGLEDGVEMLGPMQTGEQMFGDSGTELIPPEPPGWLTWAVFLVGSFLVALTIIAVFWIIRQRAAAADSTLDLLAEEVEEAIAALHTGGDLRTTIVRCYQEMSHVLRTERDISRDAAMTPREFEQRLIDRGLPPDSIRTLTRLFEQVRYGSLPTTAQDEDRALTCLNEIVAACRPTRPAHEV